MQRTTRRSRTARLKASSSRITPSRSSQGQKAVSDAAELSSTNVHTGNVLSGSRDFVVNNSTFNIRGEHDIVVQGMKTLSKRTIEGAEYDSSLRDPPPQCHPGTRIQLHKKINTWFHNKQRKKALLWLNGPAGVGKSAVIQTLAESLVESKCLGASLFFSRLKDRKDPQRVFFTVAFQLATVIPAYRTYVTEKIALNPSILSKGMKEQFRIFITEPFGKQKIGSGDGPWGVLLDGLDECDGVDEQGKIVQHVSEFVLKYPDSPLVWSISSRPEPHIVTTFTHKLVAPSHWSEYIPIDSTEACQDVERYLDTSFAAIREQYPYVPSSWPSETQFLKLAHGALGLFVFARTAVRFMEDPNHANPISRLNLILSVIDHLDVKVTGDHPFALLDALYTQILTSIPTTLQHTTKRILGFILCAQSKSSYDGLSYPLKSRSLMAASIVLGIEQSVVYGSLHKLHSVLQIPQRERAHESEVTFLHASFGDYLVDRTRSREFWIDRGGCVDEITDCLHGLYLSKPWDDGWTTYAPQLSVEVGLLFYQILKRDIELCLYYAVSGSLRTRRKRGPFVSQQDRSDCLDALSKTDTAEIYQSSEYGYELTEILFKLWKDFSEELESRELCKELKLQDLEVDHLDCGRNKPVWVSSSGRKSPDSPESLQVFVAELKSLQRSYPDTPVLVYGGAPEKRSAFAKLADIYGYQYYCIPSPY